MGHFPEGIWLVVWNHGTLWLSIDWECHHPNWRTPSFFKGVGQPPTSNLIQCLMNFVLRVRFTLYSGWCECCILGSINTLRVIRCWWFQTFLFSNNRWDNPSHWLIFFKMVKTTNQFNFVWFTLYYVLLSDQIWGKSRRRLGCFMPSWLWRVKGRPGYPKRAVGSGKCPCWIMLDGDFWGSLGWFVKFSKF